MPKKTKDEFEKYFNSPEGLHKIEAVRNGLVTGTLKHFPQIFAIIAKTNIQTLLGNEFYAFDKKIEDPGRFTFNEVETMGNFFGVGFERMSQFIRENQVLARKKQETKRKRPSSSKS
ncbi:MAG TPA: hypothetical protein VG870_11835 [Chitinophagaceae bacterium]|nr:hypothetical protein [Chitinophagaceae bacterium]